MLMRHLDETRIGQGKYYSTGWLGVIVPTAGELASVVVRYAVSPCMWAGGIRKRENFRFADWLGLDFDSGLTLFEARRAFSPYLHVIGTTKSHQVDKGGAKCDRFRVFLKFANRCRSKEDYEATADRFIKKYGADKCRDTARFFWPCKEIVVCQYWGKVIHAVDTSEVQQRKAEMLLERYEKLRLYYRPNGAIPGWINRAFEYGSSESRQLLSFKIGSCLKKLGFSEQTVVDRIMSSMIVHSKPEPFTRGECERAVNNGFKETKHS